MGSKVLEINNLTVQTRSKNAAKTLVSDVSFAVDPLSITALVGGSGSGKTTTGLSILKLLDPGLKITSGVIRFQEKDLLKCSEDDMRKVRGGQISMVFQEPLNAFNPVFSIGYQISEMLQFHTDLSKEQREKRVLELLDQVGLDDPRQAVKSYPHQLSGGMRQRAMIAQAIAANPKLIIADEPTSNLDVTLQAKIIALFKKLRDEMDLSIILISHDLGLVEHIADHIVVMSEGNVVESGDTTQILQKPKDKYTKKLLKTLRM